MKVCSKRIVLLSALLLVVAYAACSRPDTSKSGTGLVMMQGSANLLNELGALKNPDGVLPTGISFSATGIMYRDPVTTNEFFAYDANYCILILSYNPAYFIRLETKDFQFHLKNELDQFRKGLFGTNKVFNSTTYYKKLGDYQVEVYFSPQEAYFTGSGSSNEYRITDKNTTTFVDLWRLYDAAGDVTFYTPSFDDQRIADDFAVHTQSGKRRLIIADSSSVTAPAGYKIKPYGLNFSFMFGKSLSLTGNLLGCADLNDCSDKYYADPYWTTADFAAFFSVPIGNSTSGTTNHLSQKDGIVVIVRGNIGKLQSFVSAQGVDLNESPIVPVPCNVSPGDIVINEVGAACNGVSNNAYIELYNKKNCAVSLTSWKIYRASSTRCAAALPANWAIAPWNSDWTASITLNGTIPGQGYKIIGKNNYLAGTSCPTPDIVATSTNDVTASTNACLALTNGTGSKPTSVTDVGVMDFVGWGSSANFEGTVAPQMNTGSDQCISRNSDGADTNTNGTDFVAETAKPCSPGAANGTLSVVSASATTNSTTLTVYFSATPVTVQAQTPGNYCIALASASDCSSPVITVSGAGLVGKVVTLTTAAQTSSTNYRLYVTGVTSLVGAAALGKNTANFSGYGPILWSATPINATTLDLNFDSNLDSGTIDAFPGRFTFNNSLTTATATLQTGAPIANRRIRLTTPSQTPGTNYQLTVSTSVTGGGSPVNSNYTTANFYGFTPFITVAQDFGGIMEQTTASMDSITMWTNAGSGSLVNFSSPLKEGTNSMGWTDITGTCSTSARMAQSVAYYAVTPGGSYTASMFIKSGTITGANVSGRIRIYWFKDSVGTPSSNAEDLDTAPVTITASSSAWTQVLKTFTAPADAYFAQFAFHGCRSGGAATDQLYFDQVYFGP